MSCSYQDESAASGSFGLSAPTRAVPHGSQGSAATSTSRCPRVRPTVTITSTITSGSSTVPTSSGFTPILSETASVTLNPNRRRQLPSKDLDPLVVSIDSQGQVTTSASDFPNSLVCGPVTASPTSTPTIPSNCPSFSTVTTTVTTTVPSDVAYDACASNNLVNEGFGKGKNHGLDKLSFYNVTSNTGLDVLSAYDCCAACQMLGCSYGGFLANPPFPYCELYFQEECDGSLWLGNTFTYNADLVGNLPTDRGFTVFNGPCGQIVYGGSNFCKDPPCE
ncbi:MAG: hypothetical protein Q9174_004532 [Haloplaca sp. 1 TL-2023]